MKLSFRREEATPANIFPDFDWVRENWAALNEQYGDVVLVVYQKQVIGVGNTEAEALANAEANLPDSSEIITPIVKYIGKPYRIRSLRSKSILE
jgi:hypothetical protein